MTTATSRFYESRDRLKLHLRVHPPRRDEGRPPAVCLPGLTRGAVDFEVLGHALSVTSETPRLVLAFDYRGRGRSNHDEDWRRYDLETERADLLLGLERENIDAAHFVGTSRGGLHVMALAEARRALMRGVVLNDIGPVIESPGLGRIKGYVGTSVAPRSLDEAIEILKRGPGRGFDGLTPDEWRLFATTTFADPQNFDPQDFDPEAPEPRELRLRYDPKIARTLEGIDPTRPLPDNWRQFDLLRGAPLLVIRGANSDLLSAATLEAMTARFDGCESFTVPGQGHAPLLVDRPTIVRIDAFLARADGLSN